MFEDCYHTRLMSQFRRPVGCCIMPAAMHWSARTKSYIECDRQSISFPIICNMSNLY
ncbi:hypothetical protein AB0758_49345 [Tolypothrix bouteillei VB521301_2]|uniref:hypothetical protein n=1 Tax=Tolypothrix bouteillei TaxID=1246981 RepID=UPI0038B6A46A